jgi:hypothetical protein
LEEKKIQEDSPQTITVIKNKIKNLTNKLEQPIQ